MAIYAVAGFWYTAWANAGQPSLKALSGPVLNEADQKEFAEMNLSWQKGTAKGKSCD